MQTETLLLLILAGIIALLVSVFQYVYKNKSTPKLGVLFAFLRFITLFSVFLLLINPTINKLSTFVEKPNLVVAIDNSSSIKHLNQDKKAYEFIDRLLNNQQLNDKFNIKTYSFGESFRTSDSITFSEKQTNIYEAFNQLNQIYRQTQAPTLLITDGNQTYGNDYQFAHLKYKQPIFPIILGDTIKYTDLKIQQLNVNKYAYYKNKFPVEAILVYNGNGNINSKFVVSIGNTTVYSEAVNFSKTKNSQVLTFHLPANTIGVENYKATLIPLEQEKNKVNNTRNFTVEVLNQKTRVAIVSDMLHPDLGALKKSIESNQQRLVTVLKPNEVEIQEVVDFQLFILYQPNNKFSPLIKELNAQNKNQLVVIGPKTDLNFLNAISKDYQIEITNQLENYQAELNINYAPFLVSDINFKSFPPLLSNYGGVSFSVPFEVILNKTVNGISTESPLLATIEIGNTKKGILLGENIWQWRAKSFLNTKSFNEFDDFVGKLVQYLASNKQKNRLNIEYESFYNGNNHVIVKAELFNKNYVFDSRGALNITVTNQDTKETQTFPFVLRNSNYQVDLSGLPPAKYSFTVRNQHENISKSGQFQILEYYVEQQFLNANVKKLQLLAENSLGSSYFVANTQNVVDNLLNDKRFVSIQKSVKKRMSLIDWKYLLAIIAFSLGIEWFLRKYNGLI